MHSLGWWSDVTVGDLFARAVASDPARTAVDRSGEPRGAWPRRAAAAQLCGARFAPWWRSPRSCCGLGLRNGDVVLAQLPNTWECVALYLAAARTRIVLSPVAMQYRRHELDQIVALLEPRAIVTVAEFKGFDHAGLGAGLAQELVRAALVLAGDGAVDGAQLLAAGPASAADRTLVAAVAATLGGRRVHDLLDVGHRRRAEGRAALAQPVDRDQLRALRGGTDRAGRQAAEPVPDDQHGGDRRLLPELAARARARCCCITRSIRRCTCSRSPSSGRSTRSRRRRCSTC